MRILVLSLSLLCSFFYQFAWADKRAELFEQIKRDPVQLKQFIQQFPIAGELHNHLAGAPDTSFLLDLAADKHYQLCEGDQICPNGKPIRELITDKTQYQRIVGAWSMKTKQATETPADHFFASFLKFWPLVMKNRGAVLAKILSEAERQRIHYLELMILGDNNQATRLAKQIRWDDNFDRMHAALWQAGLSELVDKVPLKLDQNEQEARQILNCHAQKRFACQIPVRYQAITLREQAPVEVFTQLLLGFELASRDPRIVAVNLVQAEDGPNASKNYPLHMNMLDYFHRHYPDVPITLHAGEFTPQQLQKSTDRDRHIQQAIHLGHAKRIGHGISLPYEADLEPLLNTIKNRAVLFELNLSSNYTLLEIDPKQHPLPWFLKQEIPIALSTDDAGVLLTDLNREYLLAVQHFNLDYPTLKLINRNSLHYSFLPGESLWQDLKKEQMVPACQPYAPGSTVKQNPCHTFLSHNEKAMYQWRFEKSLRDFEENMQNHVKPLKKPSLDKSKRSS